MGNWQKYCFGNLEWYFKLNWVDNKQSQGICKRYIGRHEICTRNTFALNGIFEQEIGKSMALGVGEGFVNAMNGVKKDMLEAIVPDFDTDLNMLPSSTNSISNIKTASEVSNIGILGKLDSILSFLEYYIPGLKSRQICLDTGVLVGGLTPPINKELAKIEISRERGR